MNKSDKIMNITINHKRPLDIEKLIMVKNPVRIKARDYVDVLVFLFKYNLEMVCEMLEMEVSGEEDVTDAMNFIRTKLRNDNKSKLYLEDLVCEIQLLARELDDELPN